MAKGFDTGLLKPNTPSPEDLWFASMIKKVPELERYKHLVKFNRLPNGNLDIDLSGLPTEVVQKINKVSG